MDIAGIERIVTETASLERSALVEPEAKRILELGGIRVPDFEVAKDVDGALEAAKKVGYPVALKVISPDLSHKTDVGGVAVGIRNAAELQERWSEMILSVADDSPVAMIEGFLVERSLPAGSEVIVGATRDDQFGTVVMFGTGGVMVELMKDVSYRLAPVTRDDAFSMIQEVRGFPILTGFRGGTLRDLGAIADVIVTLSEIIEKTHGLRELEINPLIVYDHGAVAVDARGSVDVSGEAVGGEDEAGSRYGGGL